MATPVGHKILVSTTQTSPVFVRVGWFISSIMPDINRPKGALSLGEPTSKDIGNVLLAWLGSVSHLPYFAQWSKTEPKPQLLEAAGLIPCTPISIFAHCALLRRKKPATTSLGVRYRSNNRGGWKWEIDLLLIRSRGVVSKKFFEKRALTLNVTKGSIYS